jgi:hypothetical protein
MANPTTNYGWVLPTSTDLVTDLPADVDVALQGVDTTTKALNPSTTLGDIEYRSSTANTNTRLGIGTTGQVLQVTGGVPAWGSAPASAAAITYTLLSTTTANSATTLSFTGLSGKDNYVLMWQNVSFSGFGSDFIVRLNSLSTGIYNYSRVGKDTNNPTGSATDTSFRICYTQTSSIPTNGAAFFTGANGTGGKTIEAIGNVPDFVTGATQVPIAVQGIANVGATLTSINLLFGSQTFTGGTFYLWGG